jgi:PAS domain S-box-containing protein
LDPSRGGHWGALRTRRPAWVLCPLNWPAADTLTAAASYPNIASVLMRRNRNVAPHKNDRITPLPAPGFLLWTTRRPTEPGFWSEAVELTKVITGRWKFVRLRADERPVVGTRTMTIQRGGIGATGAVASLWMHDPRLKQLALSAWPAWVWSLDACRVLWANPVGAAIFGAESAAALASRAFDSGQPAAAQVERLARTLPADGSACLERLRGFGGGIGRALRCSCARLVLADGTAAILIAATEPSARALPLDERARRLLSRIEDAVALFTEQGNLICATPAARLRLGDAPSLPELSAGDLARANVGDNTANGRGAAPVVERVDDQEATVWLVSFDVADPDRAISMSVTDVSATTTPAIPTSVEEDDLEPDPAARTDQPPAASGHMSDARRLPFRFVWHMDADGHFTVESREFVALMGPATAALLGEPWSHIARTMEIDPEGRVAAAIETKDAWSGLSVAWRVDRSSDRVTVELSGLPIFDREHVFRGYRGFGLCREAEHDDAVLEANHCPPRLKASTAEIAHPSSISCEQPEANPSAENVPLQPEPTEVEAPGLSPRERHAFDELSRRLVGCINGADAADAPEPAAVETTPGPADADLAAARDPCTGRGEFVTPDARPVLDRLPIGVLIYRLDNLLYANAAFLDWAGFNSLDALTEAGGLDCLLIGPVDTAAKGGRRSFALGNPRNPASVVDAQLLRVPWRNETAFAVITTPINADAAAPTKAAIDQARAQVDEFNAILDTATDGVIVINRAARVLSSNRSAQALFGYEAHELADRRFADLFAPESVDVASGYLDRLQGTGVMSLLNDGREVLGRERNGGSIPLFMTMGRLGETAEKFCVVFRDVTPSKKIEQELSDARREAERASSANSDFLARVGHEVRTPLNAINELCEVMLDQRFGPIGNERYRQYLKDIHASGAQLISLVNDLLDLSKIEAGKLALTFTSVSLNDLTQECVAVVQQQAARDHIIIRTSLSPKLPPVTADARSLRQTVLNLLSKSIRSTAPGGQVIVSTTITDAGEVTLRVRDCGIGLREPDIATMLAPLHDDVAAAARPCSRTGLGLRLAKALAEANAARFQIRNAANGGTLVEISFPTVEVAASQL